MRERVRERVREGEREGGREEYRGWREEEKGGGKIKE